ncbi:1,4-alpha-glucan branching protein GlgB [Magnetofaba australis]|uniref:1,4-alpha-glucan branching enzyme GlgB n=1 Tax=Magnetofaba australis IT-1 TaxID=1434232 RepID=A0A1Y2K9U4_9PROT|nr:1,4-alpha-glucan branching protein GlgB [Magnetofaba australis]OSM07281.1 putative glycogen branching enzyme [Magnetofaba australis IT-1]
MNAPQLDASLALIQDARHHDPFSVLGRHPDGEQTIIRVFNPQAQTVTIAEGGHALARIPGSDVFEWRGDGKTIPERYRLIWRDHNNREHIAHDPYSFEPQISDFDLHLFGEGKHHHAFKFLGARDHEAHGVGGVRFAVWAPNAERVSVVGDFNDWDGRRHSMRARGSSGVWELFIPDLAPGGVYKYELRNRHSGEVLLKADPVGRHHELRPRTGSIVPVPSAHQWNDAAWISARQERDWLHAPMSIYEVHLGSWRRGQEGEFLDYRELAHQLADYVTEMGFTHVELLPVTEHPYDLSWGYQTTGYFAPTTRFGNPDDFRYFVDYLHQRDIGVILDWVPAHFPKDAHGLARFDGTPLYEHADPRLGEHMDWSTLIFNFSRNEVKSFLISSAVYWLDELHLDGLRVDAVASMLYLDYSRKEGEWIPNKHGGRENLDAIDFLRELNMAVHEHCPGILMMAEESTSWPQVSRPVYLGGLGFDMKWNMGWMNDTLRYIENEPIHRQYHHDMLTFSMLYCFSENFILPFSHDEVVHGKHSMLGKMPGDEWQQHANLRCLYGYQFMHPGKKLMFMGLEFAQGVEWNSASVLDWYVLDYPLHQGMQRMVKDLARLYRATPALYRYDFDWRGFEWIDCHDSQQSVLSFLRQGDDGEYAVVILNLTPVPRHDYRIGVPAPGRYQEVFNSDSELYGGGNVGNGAAPLMADEQPWMNRPYSLNLTLPPLGCLVLTPEPQQPEAAQVDESDPTDQ